MNNLTLKRTWIQKRMLGAFGFVAVSLLFIVLHVRYSNQYPNQYPVSADVPIEIVDETEQVFELEQDQTMFEAIREIANQIEVFPVDIWAENQSGPMNTLSSQINPYGLAKIRTDLPFSRFLPLFKFQKIVQSIRHEDLMNCVANIEQASPKEIALILTAIFIFERLRRPMAEGSVQKTVDVVLPHRFIPHDLTVKQWQDLLLTIKQYREDSRVAFPAILLEAKDEMELYRDQQQCNDELKRLGIVPQRPHYIHQYDNDLQKKIISLQTSSQQDAQTLAAIRYYHYICFGYPQIVQSGIGPPTGNSSAEPKTLGDIATQLLMSRLPYDGDEP